MNRIHKFRAIIPERNVVIVFTLAELLDNKFSNREILWPWLQSGNQPDEFTGLHDINGKEIFEGDIFEWQVPANVKNRLEIQFSAEIGYDTECSGYVIDACTSKQGAVIGNIRENPELLEQA